VSGGMLFFLIVCFLIGVSVLGNKGRCDICNTPIKRKYYTWTIDGKRQRLCPTCSARLERRQSKIAFDRRFGR